MNPDELLVGPLMITLYLTPALVVATAEPTMERLCEARNLKHDGKFPVLLEKPTRT